jgi:CheY-like chemotaxis protein
VRLTQIVANLLHNAAKFTSPGGTIDLAVRREAQAIVISVTDNGIGIAPEGAATIFDLFAQVGHAPDRVQDGLGIGLSLVRTLTELHGGRITVHSPGLGHGSTFEVTLPLELGDADDAGLAAPPQAATASARIVVVDDNADSADTLAELLRMGGHDVRVAYSGALGIGVARQFLPHYVFLDIGLPDLSGYEVATALRALPALQEVVLIALTGYGRAEDKKLALEAGFNEHLVKPVDFAKVASLNLPLHRVL